MTRRAADPISSDFLERLAEMKRRKEAEAKLPPSPPTAQVAPTKQESQPLPEIAATPKVAPTTQAGGYTLLTHEVTDSILRTLDPYAQAVFIQLLRLSWGFQKEECTVGLPKLAERCGFHINQARKAKRALIARGLVEDLGEDNRNAVQDLRGTRYRILLKRAPTRQVGATAPASNKEKALKDIVKLCSRCEATGGVYYPDPNDKAKGVKRCDHRV